MNTINKIDEEFTLSGPLFSIKYYPSDAYEYGYGEHGTPSGNGNGLGDEGADTDRTGNGYGGGYGYSYMRNEYGDLTVYAYSDNVDMFGNGEGEGY